MLVPAGSPIFFLREQIRCPMSRRNFEAVVHGLCLITLLFMLSMCLLHIFLYIFFIYIGCATLYHLSVMYVTL